MHAETRYRIEIIVSTHLPHVMEKLKAEIIQAAIDLGDVEGAKGVAVITTNVYSNGMLLDDKGNRSIFDDVDE